jgi:hypothetical protein
LPHPFMVFLLEPVTYWTEWGMHICFPFYTQPQVYVKTTTTNLRRYGNERLWTRGRQLENFRNLEILLGPRIEKWRKSKCICRWLQF